MEFSRKKREVPRLFRLGSPLFEEGLFCIHGNGGIAIKRLGGGETASTVKILVAAFQWR